VKIATYPSITILGGGLWVLVSVPIPLLADEATSHLNTDGTSADKSIRPGDNTVGAVRRLEPPRSSIHRLVLSHHVKSEKFRSKTSAYDY